MLFRKAVIFFVIIYTVRAVFRFLASDFDVFLLCVKRVDFFGAVYYTLYVVWNRLKIQRRFYPKGATYEKNENRCGLFL